MQDLTNVAWTVPAIAKKKETCLMAFQAQGPIA